MNSDRNLTNNNPDSFFNNAEKRICDFNYNDRRNWDWKVFDDLVYSNLVSSGVLEGLSAAYEPQKVIKVLSGITKSISNVYGRAFDAGLPCSGLTVEEPQKIIKKTQDNYKRVISKSGIDLIEVPISEEQTCDQWIDLLTRHIKGTVQSAQALNKAWKKFLEITSLFSPLDQILPFSCFLQSKPELYQKVLNVSQIMQMMGSEDAVFKIDQEMYSQEECLELTSYVIACKLINQALVVSKDNFFQFVFSSCLMIPETHCNSILKTICLYIKKSELPLANEKDQNINNFLKNLPIDQNCSLEKMLSYFILGEALSCGNEQFFPTLIRGCSLLPAVDRNAAWRMIRLYLIDKRVEIHSQEENSFEEIIAALLLNENYSFNEIFAILQTIGLIALAAPANQRTCKFAMEMVQGERLLCLSTPQSEYSFLFSWQPHADLKTGTASWKEMMPIQFKLKLLLELLLPYLDQAEKPCETFKKTFDLQNIKNLSVISFDLMRANNPFIVMLGYRLYFTERLLNSRPVVMDMKTYLGQCAIPLSYIPATKADKRRQFYELIAKYSGAAIFTDYLTKLTKTVDWSSLSLAKTITELITLLAKEKNGVFRPAAWALWSNFRISNSLTEPWTNALRSLLEHHNWQDKEKFTEALQLLKSHCETKRLYPLQAIDVYRVMIEYASNHEELQLEIAKDVLKDYSTVPNELIRSINMFHFIADIVNPLLKPEHLSLCTELIEIVTRVCENIPDEKLSSTILRVCYLLDARHPERAFALWTRIQNRFRSEKESPDIGFVISSTRRMYHAIISDTVPQPQFPYLIQILENSQTTQISQTELRKCKLVLTGDIIEQDIATACEIVHESTAENHDFNFTLRLRLLKKQLEICKSSGALEKLLPDFNYLLDMASCPEEFILLQQAYHQFFCASCTEKLYNLIVIDRLMNGSNCIAAFRGSYDNNLINLIKLIQRTKIPLQDEDFLLKQVSTAIFILAKNACQHAVITIVDTFIILDNRKKLMGPAIYGSISSTAEWLSKSLEGHPTEQKLFLGVLINRVPELLKTSLLSLWIPILTSLLKMEYAETLLKIVEKLRTKNILITNSETDQLPLVETLIDEWILHPEVPCEIDRWIEHFWCLAPSLEYLSVNANKILTWVNGLISSNHAKSAVALLKLIKTHTTGEHWNGVLNHYYETEEYDLWIQTLLSHKDVFKDSTCIQDYAQRAPVILEALLDTTKEKQTIYKRILQFLSRYPLDSVAIWRQLLENIRLLGNPELKNDVVKIVIAKDFNVALFSNDGEHGLACWTHVVTFLSDSDKFERSWLITTNFLKKPFLKGNAQDTPFLVSLLTLFLQAPKQESEKNMRIRLKEAHNIRDCLSARSVSKEQIPAKQRPQIVQLIEQSSRCKTAELYIRGCGLAESIHIDKETTAQAASAIESLFTHAVGFSNADNFRQTEVARSLKCLKSTIIANAGTFVNVYIVSRELSQCQLYRESVDVLMFAMVNQKMNASFGEIKKSREQLEIQMERLINVKMIFTDGEEELTYFTDLLWCLNNKTIEASLDRVKYRLWKEMVLSRILSLIQPKTKNFQLPRNIVPSTNLLLESYLTHLKSNIDNQVNGALLNEVMALLAIYAQTSTTFFKSSISKINEALWFHLINTNSRSFRNAPDKHADFYLDFLVNAGLAIQRLHKENPDAKGVAELRKFYKERVFCFCKLDSIYHRTKTKLIYHFSFLMMTTNNFDTFEDHMSDIRALLALAIKKGLYANPEQSIEYTTLRLVSYAEDNDSFFENLSLSGAQIEDVLERATLLLINTYSPFAINRGLEMMDTHISFISSQRFREKIISQVFVAISALNLDSLLITGSLSLLALTLRQLFEYERSNKMNLEPSQDGILMHLLMVMNQVAQNTSFNGSSHSQQLLKNYMNLLDAIEIMWSDADFLDAIERILAQLKMHEGHFDYISRKTIALYLAGKLKRKFKVENEIQSTRIQTIKVALLSLLLSSLKEHLLLRSNLHEHPLTLSDYTQVFAHFGKAAEKLFGTLISTKNSDPQARSLLEDDEEEIELNSPAVKPAAAGANLSIPLEDNDETKEELSSGEE